MAVTARREATPQAEASRPPGQSEAAAARVRCRLATLMQRACDAIHAQAARHMPLATQLQLLSVLLVLHPPCSLV